MSTDLSSQISSSLLNTLDAAEQVKLSEILDDYMERLARGEAPRQQSLIEQHPQLSEPLRVYLEKLDELQNFLARPAATMDLSGQTLDDFQLIRPIGRGGMGVVYQAWQASLQRNVAVKLLPSNSFSTTKLQERFEIESRAAAMLEHPHIVPVYSTGRAEGIRYYAMRLVDGPSLDEVILDAQESFNTTNPSFNTISVRDLKDTLTQFANLADALQAAHEVGIIHRDVKPSNILQDSSGKLWITDFGLARIANSSALTRTGEMIGTMRYMSPEQALGSGEAVDHRSDIYSLAATLYERITFRPLIEGDEGSELLTKIARAAPPKIRLPNIKFSRALEIVLQRAMAKHKDDRYSNAAEFRDDLRRIVDDVAVATRRPSSIVRSVRWCADHASFVGSAAVTLLFCSCALLATTLMYRSEYRRAQTNMKSARETVHNFGSELIDSLAMLPGAEKIRQGVVIQTLALNQDFANQSRDDLAIQVNLASSYTQMGDLCEDQGRVDEAVHNYQLAEDIYAQVARKLQSQKALDDLDPQELIRQQIDNQNRLAMAVSLRDDQTGATNQSLPLLAKTLQFAEASSREDPKSDSIAISLALTRNNYATLLLQNKSQDEAARQLKDAADLIQSIKPSEATTESISRTLAAIEQNQGLLIAESNPRQAVLHFKKAITGLLELSKSDQLRVAPELISAHLELGNLYLNRGKGLTETDLAVKQLSNARELAKLVLVILPSQQQILRLDAIANTNLGIAYSRTDRKLEGMKFLEAGISDFKVLVKNNPTRDSLKTDLALALSNHARILNDVGDLSKAMATYEKAESLLIAQRNSSALNHLQMVYQGHLESAKQIGNSHKANQLEELLRDIKEGHRPYEDEGVSL